MKTETIRLSAHEKFIIDGIKKQAGTVEKAILELTMNAIEAQLHGNGHPIVNIEFTVDDGQAKLVVRDQGRGFKTRNEIEQWFAKFGTPHDECPQCQETMRLNRRIQTFECSCGYKTEGRTWAEFRMGRGQAFSFGRNVWRTGEFRMEYDLETAPDDRTYAKADGDNHILDFSLQSNLPKQTGCEVTVYFYKNPIGNGYRSLDGFKSAIKHHIEFMEGEITFNGEQINTPASSLDWDIETEDAYFMFGKGNNLGLYNIGSFVKDYSASTMGVTGVCVSKEKLMVNFARNDVMETSCEVWKRILIIIRENRIKKVRRISRRLDNNERISTLLDIRDGACDYDDIKTIGLIELTNGKVMSLDAIRKIRSPWTIADPGNRVADRLMQVGDAICFSSDTINTLDYSGDRKLFFDWLLKEHLETDCQWVESKLELAFARVKQFYRPFVSTDAERGLSEGMSDTHRILPGNKLSKAERRFLKVMEDYACWKGRALCIGVSDTANGWTDGLTYIAFNRDYLKYNNPQYFRGASALVTLAYHELAHDDDDTGTHFHNIEFYQSYHDLTRDESTWMIGDLPQRMSSQKWQDHADEVAEKEAKKKVARDVKLGVKRVAKAKADKLAEGLVHTPAKAADNGLTRKPTKTVAKRVKKRRVRRF